MQTAPPHTPAWLQYPNWLDYPETMALSLPHEGYENTKQKAIADFDGTRHWNSGLPRHLADRDRGSADPFLMFDTAETEGAADKSLTCLAPSRFSEVSAPC